MNPIYNIYKFQNRTQIFNRLYTKQELWSEKKQQHFAGHHMIFAKPNESSCSRLAMHIWYMLMIHTDSVMHTCFFMCMEHVLSMVHKCVCLCVQTGGQVIIYIYITPQSCASVVSQCSNQHGKVIHKQLWIYTHKHTSCINGDRPPVCTLNTESMCDGCTMHEKPLANSAWGAMIWICEQNRADRCVSK